LGKYFQLECLDCSESISFGKLIRITEDLKLHLQGMYSERDSTWIDNEQCWHALQVFLFSHMGHGLVFRDDESGDAQSTTAVEFDTLRERWKCGFPELPRRKLE
jgi:hypothetical protein